MVVRKVGPAEKMGVIGLVDGRTAVVEYSDLPDELAEQRDPEGELVYWAGSIAVHCIEVDFARRLTDGGLRLPFHRALKKVPYVNDAGEPGEPDAPNAVKFETFLFDALPFAAGRSRWRRRARTCSRRSRTREGADSPETARRDLNRLNARWLEAAGVTVPRGDDGEPVDVEIDPRFALDAEELARGAAPRLPRRGTDGAQPARGQPVTIG